ncbi:major facilitator superfamily domain-containing protein [Lasiosphaeria ovina]|uniref:Major facilitator superfamily domain-containing protein n=1 Tax=Lasiosphaeria ovina TaxID=92902 RepID=A0AAE0TUJ6_9PEZI|nr:major facilitator superfamily domain-containing protein [Lasiosphaeria ovina]
MAVVNDAEVKQLPLHIDDLGADKPPSSSSDNASGKESRKSYFRNTLDKSPEERRFLFKLDATLLTFASLGYFIKHLDPFVSGMKEDLASTQPLAHPYPALELDPKLRGDLYVLRLFIGLAEGTFHPGMQYIIGSWYRKDELSKRSSISHASGALGTMFSGYLMAAVYNLNGRGGFKGWQWLFIINTAISLPIAIGSFFFLPDLPEITRACAEADAARGRANRASYTKEKFKEFFSSWHIYLFVALYVILNNGGGALSQPAFPLWPKSKSYSITQINTYPNIAAAIAVGRERAPIVFSALAYVVQAWLPLLIWQQPEAPRYFKGWVHNHDFSCRRGDWHHLFDPLLALSREGKEAGIGNGNGN